MVDRAETPFDNIESAHEYVGLLCEALEDARKSVEEDIGEAKGEGAARRLQALQLVTHNLDCLQRHLDASHRLLNDLRTLRRLLLGGREGTLRTVPAEVPGTEDEV